MLERGRVRLIHGTWFFRVRKRNSRKVSVWHDLRIHDNWLCHVGGVKKLLERSPANAVHCRVDDFDLLLAR